ncbi:MAG TPA: TetR/AcrR family transcriptional regulator [Stellaceae bacterium]|nr:TetR/AcrR family transcriptional regulator [Stellaceae bacterium]
MTTASLAAEAAVSAEADDSEKRRQIIDGARAAFLARGFDAASMGEIAREAGVSKGTLYAYFDSKEALFQAIVYEQCQRQAERLFEFDHSDRDVETVLRRLGLGYVSFLCQPARISAVRTVVGISDRMPEIGRRFYETGPMTGMARLAAYLDAQVAAGILEVEDTQIAAAQFLESCAATMLKAMLFASADPPKPERIERVVGIAVKTFLAAYRRG